MTNLLENGPIPRIMSKATAKLLMSAATLHKRAPGTDDDGNPNGAFTDYNLLGMVDTFSAYRRAAEAMPDTDVKLLVLQHLAPAAPLTGDEITLRGARYLIVAVAQDSARATWEIQARPYQ